VAQRVVAKFERGAVALYPSVVARPVIDRKAWAELLAELVQRESGGNVTAFATAVGMDRRTVTRWRRAEVAVSEESVRAVARALGLNVADVLVRLGYYRQEDLPAEPIAERLVAEDDIAIRTIRESDVPMSLKRELIAAMLERRREHEAQRLAEVERMLALARRTRRAV